MERGRPDLAFETTGVRLDAALIPQAPAHTTETDGLDGALRPVRQAYGRRRSIVDGLSIGTTAGMLATVLIFVSLVAVGLSYFGSSGRLGASLHEVELRFDSFTAAESVTVQRVWQLSGPRGTSLEGTLIFSNRTDESVEVTHDEVLPNALASSSEQITRGPRPADGETDPVVRYTLELDPYEQATVHYSVDVPPDGTERSRLERWADDLAAELAWRRGVG